MKIDPFEGLAEQNNLGGASHTIYFLLSYYRFRVVVNPPNGRSRVVAPDAIALRRFPMIGLT